MPTDSDADPVASSVIVDDPVLVAETDVDAVCDALREAVSDVLVVGDCVAVPPLFVAVISSVRETDPETVWDCDSDVDTVAEDEPEPVTVSVWDPDDDSVGDGEPSDTEDDRVVDKDDVNVWRDSVAVSSLVTDAVPLTLIVRLLDAVSSFDDVSDLEVVAEFDDDAVSEDVCVAVRVGPECDSLGDARETEPDGEWRLSVIVASSVSDSEAVVLAVVETVTLAVCDAVLDTVAVPPVMVAVTDSVWDAVVVSELLNVVETVDVADAVAEAVVVCVVLAVAVSSSVFVADPSLIVADDDIVRVPYVCVPVTVPVTVDDPADFDNVESSLWDAVLDDDAVGVSEVVALLVPVTSSVSDRVADPNVTVWDPDVVSEAVCVWDPNVVVTLSDVDAVGLSVCVLSSVPVVDTDLDVVRDSDDVTSSEALRVGDPNVSLADRSLVSDSDKEALADPVSTVPVSSSVNVSVCDTELVRVAESVSVAELEGVGDIELVPESVFRVADCEWSPVAESWVVDIDTVKEEEALSETEVVSVFLVSVSEGDCVAVA